MDKGQEFQVMFRQTWWKVGMWSLWLWHWCGCWCQVIWAIEDGKRMFLSSAVQFQSACVNCSFRFLFVADWNGTWCGGLLLSIRLAVLCVWGCSFAHHGCRVCLFELPWLFCQLKPAMHVCMLYKLLGMKILGDQRFSNTQTILSGTNNHAIVGL